MKRKFNLEKVHPSAKRFFLMKPRKYGAEDIDVMENRVALLDALFEIDGRSNKDHPMHNLYTGLYSKYIKD
jgi:hypothetical protein